MTSLCLAKLRTAGALAFLVTLAGACGVPDYNVSNIPDSGGVLPPVTTGGSSATSSGGSSSKAGGGGGNSSLGTGGQPAQDASKCNSDLDCTTFSATKVCDTSNLPGRCVECLPKGTLCGTGLYCGDGNQCHVGCAKDSDCGTTSGDASPGAPLICNTTTHQCSGCETDADCKSGAECDATTGTCVPGCGGDKNCPTNWLCCGGLCANPKMDAKNCGKCESKCPDTNANPQCLNGACGIASCKVGYKDCNNTWTDGCEVDLLSNKANCGDCNIACGTQICISGKCGDSTCANTDYMNCSGNPTGFCDINIKRNPLNCGGCGNKCSEANGTASCDAGNCIISCTSGYDDCDSSVVNGCETDLNANANHCGNCTNACKNDHGVTRCSGGKCAPSCLTGYGDCDGDLTNGCEANESSDPIHCGSCQACSLDYATASCTNGSCTIATCQPNRADCNNKASDGCETL